MAQNTERLILTVQKYPVLYNTTLAKYKNLRIKNKIWVIIANKLGDKDIDGLKVKWKNLRDAYGKHLRCSNITTGQASKLVDRYKAWPWAQQMSFVRPYLNISELAPCASDPDDTKHESAKRRTAASEPVYKRRKRKAHVESQVDRVINFLNQRKEEFDDTDLLFLAHAKKIKKLAMRRQAKVKFDIAKIIMKAELEESYELEAALDARLELSLGNNIEPSPVCSPNADTHPSNSPTYIITSPTEFPELDICTADSSGDVMTTFENVESLQSPGSSSATTRPKKIRKTCTKPV